MPYVLILHHVDDYPAWKAHFDAAAGLRKAAGEEQYQVLGADDDINSIVHFSRWRDLGEARRFFESDTVADIRRKAGVTAPVFMYLDELARGEL